MSIILDRQFSQPDSSLDSKALFNKSFLQNTVTFSHFPIELQTQTFENTGYPQNKGKKANSNTIYNQLFVTFLEKSHRCFFIFSIEKVIPSNFSFSPIFLVWGRRRGQCVRPVESQDLGQSLTLAVNKTSTVIIHSHYFFAFCFEVELL